jgi:tetratricopeptide (TPR) repeat protein
MTAAVFRAVVGEGEDALRILDELGISDDNDDPDLLAGRSLVLLVSGRYDDAYRTATRALSLDPSGAGSRANVACLLALAAAASGRPREAIEHGHEVGRLGGTYLDQTRAHLARALAYRSTGSETEARTALDSARRIVAATSDEVTKSLVELADAVLVSGDDEADPRLEAARGRCRRLGVTWESWERVYRAAARPHVATPSASASQ